MRPQQDHSEITARSQWDFSETTVSLQRDLRDPSSSPQPDLSEITARPQWDLSETSARNYWCHNETTETTTRLQGDHSGTTARPRQIYSETLPGDFPTCHFSNSFLESDFSDCCWMDSIPFKTLLFTWMSNSLVAQNCYSENRLILTFDNNRMLTQPPYLHFCIHSMQFAFVIVAVLRLNWGFLC